MLFNRIWKTCLLAALFLSVLFVSEGLSQAQAPSATPAANPSSGQSKRPKRDSQGSGRYVNVAANRLVFAGAAGPRDKVSKEAQAVFDRGRTLYEEGRLPEAIEAFRAATRMSPDWAVGHYLLGGALAESGQLQDSLKPLKLVMQLKPDTDQTDLYILAAYSLGNSYFGLGRYKEAAEAFKEANSRNPSLSKLRYNLGLAFVRLGKLRDAVQEFKEAVRLKPEYAEARYNLGLAYLDMKEKELALEQQKELKRLDAELAELLEGFVSGGAK